MTRKYPGNDRRRNRFVRIIRNELGTLVMRLDRRGVMRKCERSIRFYRNSLLSLLGIHKGRSYQNWVKIHDSMNKHRQESVLREMNALAVKPLISVIMPVCDPNPEWLSAAVESVRRQLYTNWELCIADDASVSPEIHRLLKGFVLTDPRIKVHFRKERGHIATCSNTAMKSATGEWVALLDHDDLLSADALFCVASAINRNPSLKLIYSDEDKIDATGNTRSSPYFKPDWDYDLFCHQNLISHLGVYRRDTLEEIGGFRSGFDGSQDYDMAFRFIERITEKEIHHIPKVLYHWRMHPESTSLNPDSKSYARTAAHRAVSEHFQRTNTPASLDLVDGAVRIRHSLPDPLPLVSIIIATRNARNLLERCIDSILRKTIYLNYEILVVDNGSDEEPTLEYLRELSDKNLARVIRDEGPFNYSALNNSAAREAKGEMLCLLNNDTEVISPGWLSDLVAHAVRKTTGAAGALLFYPDDTVQHAGVVLGESKIVNIFRHVTRKQKSGVAWLLSVKQYQVVTAACLVVRKSLYLEMGGMDERNLHVEFNDVDFCLKLHEAGYRNLFVPHAELYHHECATRGVDNTPAKLKRHYAEFDYLRRRWGHLMVSDPCFNPNLCLTEKPFVPAFPPRKHPAS